MEQLIIKITKKISLKLNIIFIILITSMIFYYMNNQKNFSESEKLEQIALICNQLKDSVSNLKQTNNSNSFDTRTPSNNSTENSIQNNCEQNTKSIHFFIDVFNNIQNIKNSIYTGEDYSRYIDQLYNINDDKVKALVSEISSYNSNFLSISELIKMLDKINIMNKQNDLNNQSNQTKSYISGIIKIKRPSLYDNNFLINIKNCIIDKKFDLVLKHLENLETDGYNVSNLKEKVKLITSIELALENLKLYLFSDDFIKLRL